jgi:hypothetical protein
MEKKEIKSKLKEIISKGGKMLTFLIIFAFGYIACDLYHKSKEKPPVILSEPKLTKRLKNVSVAINERNELMIIDRSNGSYEIYQDSIGKCIFNLYANIIHSKYQGQ